MPRIVAHVDLDCFFAAVEVLDDPSLAGRPVIVGADPKGGKGRGVVAAASYEARKFGVHSALPISKAYRLCPQGVFLQGRGRRYGEVSEQVMEVLLGFTPAIEQISVDEAFLDLTGCQRLLGQPREIGLKIKRAVRERTKLVASVGIGPNKLVAKIASDLEKPDGLVVVAEDAVVGFLAPLGIRKLWGIGPKTEERLIKSFGIRTVGELARIPAQRLEREFGTMGAYLHQRANGVDDDPVGGEQEAKSTGREVTFDEDTEDLELIHQTLVHICDRVAAGLRDDGLKGRTVTLKLRYEDFETHTFRTTLPEATCSFRTILDLAEKLLSDNYQKRRKVRLVGAYVSNFGPAPSEGLRPAGGEALELGLFDAEERGRKREQQVDQAVDQLRRKFGKRSVRRAGEL